MSFLLQFPETNEADLYSFLASLEPNKYQQLHIGCTKNFVEHLVRFIGAQPFEPRTEREQQYLYCEALRLVEKMCVPYLNTVSELYLVSAHLAEQMLSVCIEELSRVEEYYIKATFSHGLLSAIPAYDKLTIIIGKLMFYHSVPFSMFNWEELAAYYMEVVQVVNPEDSDIGSFWIQFTNSRYEVYDIRTQVAHTQLIDSLATSSLPILTSQYSPPVLNSVFLKRQVDHSNRDVYQQNSFHYSKSWYAGDTILASSKPYFSLKPQVLRQHTSSSSTPEPVSEKSEVPHIIKCQNLLRIEYFVSWASLTVIPGGIVSLVKDKQIPQHSLPCYFLRSGADQNTAQVCICVYQS